MKPIGRRDLLMQMGAAPMAAGLAVSGAWAQRAHDHVRRAPGAAGESAAPPSPRFFDPHEWATVRVLADLVIPADERSGGATEARVPEFVDFILSDPLASPREREEAQTAIRGGLAWLDHECRRRYSRPFVEGADADRRAVLDDIAWPERAAPEMGPGVAFFNAFRDLVAAGFWSSRVGVEDLAYQGNTFVAEWKGCPPEVLAKIGVGLKVGGDT
jgi:gluconate 2-dehydrogenase gamma chain